MTLNLHNCFNGDGRGQGFSNQPVGPKNRGFSTSAKLHVLRHGPHSGRCRFAWRCLNWKTRATSSKAHRPVAATVLGTLALWVVPVKPGYAKECHPQTVWLYRRGSSKRAWGQRSICWATADASLAKPSVLLAHAARPSGSTRRRRRTT